VDAIWFTQTGYLFDPLNQAGIPALTTGFDFHREARHQSLSWQRTTPEISLYEKADTVSKDAPAYGTVGCQRNNPLLSLIATGFSKSGRQLGRAAGVQCKLARVLENL
jgi:hypothetical protein